MEQKLFSKKDLFPPKSKQFENTDLTTKIIVKNGVDDLEKLFSLEDKDFPNKRASYEVKKTKNGLEFDIRATDSVALRSVLNTITKIITVYEKTVGALKNE